MLVRVQGDPDLGGVARQHFVNRVVYHLKQKVMQAVWAGVANVHGRPGADMLDTFQQADRVGGIFLADMAHTGRVLLTDIYLFTVFQERFHDLPAGRVQQGHIFRLPFIPQPIERHRLRAFCFPVQQ